MCTVQHIALAEWSEHAGYLEGKWFNFHGEFADYIITLVWKAD